MKRVKKQEQKVEKKKKTKDKEKGWIRLWQTNKTKAKCVTRYVAYKHIYE